MTKKFPRYANPPIIELVLGVQFDSIPGFTTGHSGWFWREHLGSDWKVSEGQPVPEQTEAFGKLLPGRMGFHLSQNPASRLMAENQAGDRLLQIQHSRMHYNWRKKDGEYPHFEQVFDEFNGHFTAFKEFVINAGLNPVVANQWEVTYVDNIPSGELWQRAEDFCKVFPGLFPDDARMVGLIAETSNVDRTYEIAPQKGRLYVTTNLALISGEKDHSLLVNMTARGPVASDSATTLKEHMEIGHVATGQAFSGLSSDAAKRFWERV